MNKKSLFGLFAMGTLLFTASCQEEDVVKQAQENSLATVSINVTTPEMGVATRAMTFGNGKTAKTLHYAVYNVKGQELTYLPDLTVDNHPIDITTTVDLQLVTGNDYKVIFWAGNDAAISTGDEARLYTLNWDAKDENGACNPTMTVDYDKALSNQETYDAFFNWMDINVDKSKEVSITLNRPFAQLNIGASDIAQAESAGYKLKQTQVKMTAYTTLEFWSRDVDRESETSVVVDFQATDYPNYGKTKPATEEELATSNWEEYQVEGYEYMAMNYLLRPLDENKELEDIEFYFYAEDGEKKERKYASVPFRRNWRTNVYGQLITSDVDVNVIINPIFDGSYNVGVWDGHTLTKPYSIKKDNNTPGNDKDDFYEVHVYNGAELAYIADAINGGGQSNAENNGTRAADSDDNVDYYTATIVLKENIDLGGENWKPIKGVKYINAKGKEALKRFTGTFDGNGHTISNLYVRTEGKDAAGLFATTGGTIKNLIVKDAKVYGNYKAGVIVGDGLCAKIENCHVDASDPANPNIVLSTPHKTEKGYDDANNVGGIVGYLSAEPTAYVKDCTVKNADITAYRKVGGIVGAANGKAEVTGNTVEKVNVVADFTYEYASVEDANVGTIVGWRHESATVNNNTEVAPTFAGNKLADGAYIVNGAYEISNANGLVWVEAQEDKYFAGKTIKLTNNIDMAGVTIEKPIKFWSGRTTVDGQEHIISNLTMSTESQEKQPFGLFGGTADIKNLKFDNANISGYSYVAVVAGNLYGNIENCHVANSTVTCTYWMAGALSGQYNAGNVTNCSATNTTVTGPAAVGALIGNINETAGERKVENCSVEKCTVVQKGSFGDVYDKMFGAVVGLINIKNSEVHFNECSVAETTVKGEQSDELYGIVEAETKIFIDGHEIINAADADALNAAVAVENAIVNLSAGEWTFPSSSIAAGVTVICEEGTVFTGTSDLNIKGSTIIGATFKNENGKAVSGTIYGTFKDCTFEGEETLRWCYTKEGQDVVFENCVVKTSLRGIHFDGMAGNVTFKNCEINGFNAYSGTGTMTFEGCTFGHDASKYNGLNIYSNTVLANCTFTYVSGNTNFIDMEGTGKTLTINECTATLDGSSIAVSEMIGGSKLAQNTVTIDGVEL